MSDPHRILSLFQEHKSSYGCHCEDILAMLRYQSRRHQRLMDESEQALWNATDAKSKHDSRIAGHILSDPKTHRMWEARHAELVRPVAQERKRQQQVFALRDIEVGLIHRTALINHIRNQKLRGPERDQMIAAFYGPKDIRDAILFEHQHYMLAVSSHLSTGHLINVMNDPLGNRLLRQYEMLYANFFNLYGYVVRAPDPIWADAARPLITEAREQLAKIRQRIRSARPDNRHADFDRQALLARSGRYPIQNYMVG